MHKFVILLLHSANRFFCLSYCNALTSNFMRTIEVAQEPSKTCFWVKSTLTEASDNINCQPPFSQGNERRECNNYWLLMNET